MCKITRNKLGGVVYTDESDKPKRLIRTDYSYLRVINKKYSKDSISKHSEQFNEQIKQRL